MSTLASWCLILAIVGYFVWLWLEMRAADREAAMRRHPAGKANDPRNLPISEYAVMVAAEKVAEDYARIELADDGYIYALVEVDHR